MKYIPKTSVALLLFLTSVACQEGTDPSVEAVERLRYCEHKAHRTI